MVSHTIKRYGTRLALALVCIPLAAQPPKHRAKPTPYAQAVAARAALPAQPTRAQYTVVLDQFRAIYHANPADLHSPDSIWNVAELLADAGRKLPDPKLSQNAISQYEFLRKNYPASHYRADALLAEARIESDDLNDRADARAKYQLLLKTYPHGPQVATAQAALEALKHPSRAPQTTAQISAPPPEAPRGTLSAMPAAPPLPPSETAPSAPVTEVLPSFDGAVKHKQPTLITSIRHWSTPSYTRVAIDLSDEVQYEAARVPHPDRIYFDLHGSRLSPDLAGKTFDVTDDGFLKKIRAAQFSTDVIRVVLDVNDVSDYSAFLLPNPYRLIIDIHGGAARTANGASRKDATPDATPSTPVTVPADSHTGVAHPEDDVALDAADAAPLKSAPTAARSTASMNVPNTTARKTNNVDVDKLSQRTDKVKATAAPTSKPISATVTQHDSSPAQPADLLRELKPGDAAAPTDAPPAAPTPAPRSSHKSSTIAPAAAPAHEAELTASGQRSLARALGLKVGRVVIDAGHGGHDSGTLGVGGIEEKDVVLDVALRLGKLLQDKLGVEVIYTRSDDTFIPLETRTAIANKAQADLFISIHANSSSDASARGVETYYLNFTSDPNALEVAARENAVSASSVYQLSDLVKKITLKDKIDESREFALDVDTSLYAGLQHGNAGLKNRGIKKAPFVVLIGANMPSILTEISFVTNAKDASQLQQPAYRERVAESIFKGVSKYANGLSGVRSAQPATMAVAATHPAP